MEWFKPDEINIPEGHFVGGDIVSFPSDTLKEVICPSSGKPYAKLGCASKEQTDLIIDQTYRTFRDSDWAKLAPRERASYLFKWATLIESSKEYLAQLESIGSSRPYHDVLAWDIPYIVDCLRFFAELADKHGGYIGATKHNSLGMVINQPYGVVGAITPWNFPMSMLMWKVAPALAAGNAVVLKPSELTPFTSVYLAQLALEAGIPKNIFNVIQGEGHSVGQAICEHRYISKVSFTGSTLTGAAIMSTCALKGPKPTTLELGGKSPQIVFADADIDKTVTTVVKAITGNAGQVCVSGSRLIVEDSIADSFVHKLVQHFEAFTSGATWDSQTTLPPIISHKQAARIHSIVNKSIEQGAKALCGAKLIEQGGSYYLPTLLKITDNSNCAVQEEIFGPVLTVQTFATDEEAWSLASHETYGLAAGIHTKNIDRALTGMKSIEAGSVWINRYGRSFDHILPTGGFKQSGIGKDIGVEAFQACFHSKSVLIDFE